VPPLKYLNNLIDHLIVAVYLMDRRVFNDYMSLFPLNKVPIVVSLQITIIEEYL